jgi:hypothetical protein
MARHGRYFLPDQPLHVIQRGNNRSAIFFGIEDYEHYRNWLAEAAAEYGCVIHAYVLIPTTCISWSLPSVPRACRAQCNRSAGAMCARSMPPNGAAAPYGRGAIGRLRSTASRTSWLAAAISSSTRCARTWWHTRPITDGRATGPHAHGAADALVSDHPLAKPSGAAQQRARRPIGTCSKRHSSRVSWTRCARRQMVGGRLATQASSASSPTRADGASRRCQEADRAGSVPPNSSSLIYSDAFPPLPFGCAA